MIYYYKEKNLRFAEVWYNNNEKPEKKVDIIRYENTYTKEHKKYFFYKEKFEVLFDLTQDSEVIFKNMHKTTRQEINRAKKENVKCVTFYECGENNDNKLLEYIDFFNQSAVLKKRYMAIQKNLENIKRYEKKLYIRYATFEDEETFLVMHAYTVVDNIARLFQSASHFRGIEDNSYRQMLGRINRLLHLNDMIYFKNQGLSYYSLGEWSDDATNKAQQAINKFKESFGGALTPQYSYCIPVSMVGGLYVLYQTIRNGLSKIKIIKKNISYRIS
jgi:hypothetical protein